MTTLGGLRFGEKFEVAFRRMYAVQGEVCVPTQHLLYNEGKSRPCHGSGG
jgi:hypothetical protein